ncbi:hypothetical protein TNCV_1318981 [Trichonephila clavipes]|nr:hypothetical protein TNCV_1318981 [Trichonephila clavipes]
MVKEDVDLERQINLEMESDDVQKLLDSYNQEEMTILMRAPRNACISKCQDVDEFESLDLVQSEDRITIGNLTEDLSFIE